MNVENLLKIFLKKKGNDITVISFNNILKNVIINTFGGVACIVHCIVNIALIHLMMW